MSDGRDVQLLAHRGGELGDLGGVVVGVGVLGLERRGQRSQSRDVGVLEMLLHARAHDHLAGLERERLAQPDLGGGELARADLSYTSISANGFDSTGSGSIRSDR